MRLTRKNWWTYLTQPIVGFDEGQGAGSGESGQGSSEGANGAGEGSEAGQGSAGTGTEGAGASEDVSGLKSALQKEREEKKALEKELKTFRKSKEDRELAEKTEVDQATTKARKAEEKAAKLAEGFRKNAVNQAILKAAGAAKFRDPSDALRPEVLAAVGVEQDEDDPTEITIDEKSVTEAIKKLARSKPHYLATEDKQRQTPKSGSQFGGSGNQSNLTADEQALAKKYPALGRRF
jgi:hypothetical protein